MAETVVRPSTKLLKPFYAVAVILTLGVFLVNSTASQGPASRINRDLFYLFPALILAWTGARHIGLRGTKLSLGAQQLVYESGILGKTTRTVELRRVQEVRVDQSVGQRMLRTGTITVETVGGSQPLSMQNIDGPHEVARLIREGAQRAGMPTQPSENPLPAAGGDKTA